MNEIFETLRDSLTDFLKKIDKAASPDELYIEHSEAMNYFLGWSHAAIYLSVNPDDRRLILEMIGTMCDELSTAYMAREEEIDKALEVEFNERGGFDGEH